MFPKQLLHIYAEQIRPEIELTSKITPYIHFDSGELVWRHSTEMGQHQHLDTRLCRDLADLPRCGNHQIREQLTSWGCQIRIGEKAALNQDICAACKCNQTVAFFSPENRPGSHWT